MPLAIKTFKQTNPQVLVYPAKQIRQNPITYKSRKPISKIIKPMQAKAKKITKRPTHLNA